MKLQKINIFKIVIRAVEDGRSFILCLTISRIIMSIDDQNYPLRTDEQTQNKEKHQL